MAILADGVVAFYGLLALLILAPLPFGSILPWAESLLTFSVFGLLAAWAVRPGISPAPGSQTAERGLGILLALWALAVAYALFQVLPLPTDVLAAMSPALRDLYGWALPDYGQGGVWRSLSTTPGATIESGLLIGTCGTAFFLVARHCRRRERILTLAVIMVLAGAGEAILGLIQVGGSHSVSRPATGTFVNRNHFAALLAMALCLGVGLLLSRWRGGAVAPVPHVHFDRWTRTAPLILACLTILAGIIFSYSRMGLTAPVLMMVLFGGIWLSGPVSNRIRLVGTGVGLVLLLLMAGAWPALAVVADRFRTMEETARVVAWEGTYALFQSSPAVGIGLGGLLDNLPRFLTLPISEPFQHSHNELLEVLAEGGVIYAALIGSGLIVYVATVVPAFFRQHDPVVRGLGAGCLAAIGAILLHSLVDFPLRMPANALYLSVIMGMGWAINLTPSPSKKPIAHRRNERPPLITRGLIYSLAIVGMGFGAVMCSADMLQRAGDDYMARALQATGDVRQKLLEQAVETYRLAQRLEPWQPRHAVKMGYAYEITASTLMPPSIDSQPAWIAAATSYGQAVLRHPANGGLQADLAWAALQRGDLIGSRRAVHAALKLAPDYPDVRYTVARWYLAQWEALSAEDQELAVELVQRGARELPEVYVDTTWQLLRNLKTVRSILPSHPNVRRLLLNKLTEQGLFADRWAEQRDHPYLLGQVPPDGFQVLAQGRLVGRQEPPPESATVGPWTGTASRWLSGGLTAKVDLDLPPGEAVLYVPILAEPAGGVWPSLSVTLGGFELPLPAISGPGWCIAYVLLSTPGGRLPLVAIVTNGTVMPENGRFAERRVRLGPVKMLVPRSLGTRTDVSSHEQSPQS